MIADGLSTFGVLTEMSDEVTQNRIHYRGVAYTLAPLALPGQYGNTWGEMWDFVAAR